MASKDTFEGNIPQSSFKCPVCFRKISSRASLLRHVQTIHETRQIFPCRVCHLSFKRKYDLSRHSRIHDTIRQFLCDTCGRGFSRKDNLNLHRRQKHGIGKIRQDPCHYQGQGQIWRPRAEGSFEGEGQLENTFLDEEYGSGHNGHFVGGRGPTPQHPDPVPYNPLTSPSANRFQSDLAAFNLQGEPSGTSNVVNPEVEIHETKPQIAQILDPGAVSGPQVRQTGIRNTGSSFRPTFAQQRVARAQQLRHGNFQMGSRGGMASRQQHHPQTQQRMAAPSSTVTSSAPPLKRPRLDPPRPMAQTASSRQMGQAPVQRQNMGGFNQSHGQMSAPRNAMGSPTRLMSQSPPRPIGRPMQPRQMSRSPQAQVMRPSSQQMNTNANRQTNSDSLERAFLNPDHSSHIMTELSALWKSGKFVDAAILVGGMKLQAHRMVLFAASPYLRASFDHLNPTTELRLKMPSDIKLDIVFQFLTYIYDGVLKLNPSNVVSLLKISLMLQMEHLTACCREYMAQAVKTGAMPRIREQDVETPLLVLMDQKPPDSGQMKTDMCTQTVSDSNRSQPRFQSNPRVDFERVFGEENIRTSDHSRNQSNQNVQSDVDLYRDYGSDACRQDDDDDGGGQGGRGMQTTDDADATPMMIIKNEFVDPEYELSLNTQHETSPAADCDNVSDSSNQTEDRLEHTPNVHSNSISDVPDTGAPGASESMQVVPGMDLDASSHSSSDMPDHALDQSTNDTVDQPTLNISTYDSLQQCDDSPSVPNPESNLAPSLDPSFTSIDESSFAETQDQSYTGNRTSSDKHGESSATVDNSLTFEPSGPDQSVGMEESGDEATPQFGTEQFLSSDFDVQPTKSEPKDPM